MEDQRPARPIRIAVLALAIACLGLAMCTRTQGPSTQQAPANHGGEKTAATPADAAPEPPPYYFSATKAPGPIYAPPQAPPQPQQQAVQH